MFNSYYGIYANESVQLLLVLYSLISSEAASLK